MKLEKLRILHSELETLIGEEVINAEIYYLYLDKWHELISGDLCNEQQNYSLKMCTSEEEPYHAVKSSDAWYFMTTGQYAIRLTFPLSPKKDKRIRWRELLIKAEERSSNAYKVSHNPLTHLLARDEFKKRLGNLIKESQSSDFKFEDIEEISPHKALAVFALDIDHFKQVNDTWGHLYGDQVLKVFGKRIDDCATKILKSAPKETSINLGHPSGEEFLISIKSAATREQFIDWANEFRKSISESVLPNDAEWNWLIENDSTNSITPPPLHQRVVTTSIGISFHNSSNTNNVEIKAVSDLLERSDTALYRSKAAGRNQVVSYDEIQASYGRVIEFNQNNGVVALDIGANVGVSVGQEFKVYSPIFTGRTDFFISDGRSKRSLGTYPRVQNSRVVVFDSQPEISFAYVADKKETSTPIEIGSHLEAIPTGSIGHLLPTSSNYLTPAGRTQTGNAISEIKKYLVSTNTKNLKPFAIIFRITRESEFLKKFGSVAFNAALAQLYSEAQLNFQMAAHVELIDVGTVCIVGNQSEYREELLNIITAKISSKLPELDLCIGVYCENDKIASGKEGQDKLNSEHALEFARFAASDAGRSDDSTIRHFSYSTAISIIKSHRESRNLDAAEADCNTLRELGVISGSMLNYAGLIASSRKDHKKAMDFYQMAMSRSPNNLTFKSNFGTAAYSEGDVDSGLKILNTFSDEDLERIKGIHPFGYVSYARLLAQAKLTDSSFFNKERFEMMAPKALEIPEQQDIKANAVILDAMKN